MDANQIYRDVGDHAFGSIAVRGCGKKIKYFVAKLLTQALQYKVIK
jgi:hypothetical protein